MVVRVMGFVKIAKNLLIRKRLICCSFCRIYKANGTNLKFDEIALFVWLMRMYFIFFKG
jgi:hypothetical protein